MKKQKFINVSVKSEIDKFPFVEIEWLDIISESAWQNFNEIENLKLPICISKGHLYSRKNGIVKIFGDYSLKNNGLIDEISNITLIPNSVIKKIKYLIIN